MLVKTETEHLVCTRSKDKNGVPYWNIFEKDNKKKPVAIYVDRHTMHFANELPTDMTQYRFFDEMREIVVELCKFGGAK